MMHKTLLLLEGVLEADTAAFALGVVMCLFRPIDGMTCAS